MKNNKNNRPKTQTEPWKSERKWNDPRWQAVDRVNAPQWTLSGHSTSLQWLAAQLHQRRRLVKCWFQQNDEIFNQCFCQNNKDKLHPQGITLSKYRKFIFMDALCSLKEWYNSCASQRWENVNRNAMVTWILQQDMNKCFCSGLHKHSRI